MYSFGGTLFIQVISSFFLLLPSFLYIFSLSLPLLYSRVLYIISCMSVYAYMLYSYYKIQPYVHSSPTSPLLLSLFWLPYYMSLFLYLFVHFLLLVKEPH